MSTPLYRIPGAPANPAPAEPAAGAPAAPPAGGEGAAAPARSVAEVLAASRIVKRIDVLAGAQVEYAQDFIARQGQPAAVRRESHILQADPGSAAGQAAV